MSPEVTLLKKHRLERLSVELCGVVMIVILALPGVSLASSNLTFAYSDKSPPYSFSLNGKTLGLLPDLVQLTFSFIPGYTTEHEVVPWARAQYNVRLGLADGLLTYPSKERKEYAVFSDQPLFTQDFGHLVYSADNPNSDLIESATSFADLSSLTVIVERGSRWEEDNIPGYLEREPGRDMKAMMHLLMLREAGDFMVQHAEDARYIAQQLGYSEKLRVPQDGFILNSRIPFHIGVSRQHPSAMHVTNEVNAVMQNPEFQSELHALIRRYR